MNHHNLHCWCRGFCFGWKPTSNQLQHTPLALSFSLFRQLPNYYGWTASRFHKRSFLEPRRSVWRETSPYMMNAGVSPSNISPRYEQKMVAKQRYQGPGHHSQPCIEKWSTKGSETSLTRRKSLADKGQLFRTPGCKKAEHEIHGAEKAREPGSTTVSRTKTKWKTNFSPDEVKTLEMKWN